MHSELSGRAIESEHGHVFVLGPVFAHHLERSEEKKSQCGYVCR